MENPRTMNIQNRPAARQIQPIEFRGRLEAIRAPTRGKARNGTNINKLLSDPEVPQSLGTCVAGPDEREGMVNATLIKNMATERPASDHASQATARIPSIPGPCCLVPVVTASLYRTTVSRTLRRALRTEGFPRGDVRAGPIRKTKPCWRRYSPLSSR